MGTILIDKLLSAAIKQGASDLHITVGQPPVLRLHGRMQKLKTKVLEHEDTMGLMKSITPDRCQQEFQETGSTDFGFAFGDAARFRVSVFRQRGKVAMVLRQIPVELWTMDDLKLPEVFKKMILRPRGLVLVTGPTGSGKTTTLATMVDWINTNLDRHVVTIEDPIEYYHAHKQGLVTQREIGEDVSTFTEAMRRVLRQDPDVILLGEMRDLDTISAAITAAETGHLVFGTLHTTGSARTVDRIIDAFPANQQGQVRAQLSVSIQAVISQVLLPRADGPGRVAAFEVMLMTPAIGNLIRKNETQKITSTIQTSKRFGMITLDDYLLDLVQRGVVTREVALDAAQSPSDLEARL